MPVSQLMRFASLGAIPRCMLKRNICQRKRNTSLSLYTDLPDIRTIPGGFGVYLSARRPRRREWRPVGWLKWIPGTALQPCGAGA